MFRRYLPTVLALTMVGTACSSESTGPTLPGTALDSVLRLARAQTGVPAMAAIVFHGDRIEAMGAQGLRRLGQSAPVTSQDRFHLGSNVKAMTATMIATLVDAGALAWTMRPVDVFPELAGSIHPGLQQVTLAQLLEHRAGIEPLEDFREVPPLPGTPAEQRYAGAAMLLQLGPAGPVGEYLYSNGGYAIAAAMAERVTGKAWEELMQERLFAPLGITPLFGWPAIGRSDAPWGHEQAGTSFVPHDPRTDPDAARVPAALAPAGEMALSIEQYLRFGQLHLRGLTGRPELLTAATFAALHTPVGHYAMGWGEIDLGGEPTSTHNGSTGTFYATIFLQPGRDLGVIVLSNAGGELAATATVATGLELLRRYGGAVPDGAVAAGLILR